MPKNPRFEVIVTARAYELGKDELGNEIRLARELSHAASVRTSAPKARDAIVKALEAIQHDARDF